MRRSHPANHVYHPKIWKEKKNVTRSFFFLRKNWLSPSFCWWLTLYDTASRLRKCVYVWYTYSTWYVLLFIADLNFYLPGCVLRRCVRCAWRRTRIGANQRCNKCKGCLLPDCGKCWWVFFFVSIGVTTVVFLGLECGMGWGVGGTSMINITRIILQLYVMRFFLVVWCFSSFLGWRVWDGGGKALAWFIIRLDMSNLISMTVDGEQES